MESHRLYYSRFCYFCQKVLMVLRNRDHEIELASTSDGKHRNELIEGGGKGQVPCLRIQDASGNVRWLYESDDIIDYIKQQNLAA